MDSGGPGLLTVSGRTAVTTRRRFLRATAGLGVGATGIGSVNATTTQETEPGDELWHYTANVDVQSSPTIVDGTVYVGDSTGTVHAVDAASGDEEWQFETGQSGSVNTSPAVVDDTVYVASANGVFAIDMDEGEEHWHAEEVRGDPDISGLQSSPTVVDETVYVGSLDGSVYALSADAGDEDWHYETDSFVQSSPTVVDGTVYVGSSGGTVYGIDAATGDDAWEFDAGGIVTSSPTVADDAVIVGSGPDRTLYALSAEAGDELWRFETEFDLFSSPTVADGTVFVGGQNGDDEGALFGVSVGSGDEAWRNELDRIVYSSPTVAGDAVFVGSSRIDAQNPENDEGTLHAFDANSGDERWRSVVGTDTYSSPTVADGTVYVGSSDRTQGSGNTGKLSAFDAGGSGSSEGSRVMLGTLGHHGGWRYGDGGGLPLVGDLGSAGTIGVGVGAAGLLGGAAYAWRRHSSGRGGDR